METILGINLTENEKQVIISCMKYALEKDKDEYFLTEENRRLLSTLISDFTNLDHTLKKRRNTELKQIIKKNLQLENMKSILVY